LLAGTFCTLALTQVEQAGNTPTFSFLVPQMRSIDVSAQHALAVDASFATLIGRLQVPDVGPLVIRVDGDDLVDVTTHFPTVRDLCEQPDPAMAAKMVKGPIVGSLNAALANSDAMRHDPTKPSFLAPIDLQAVKAAGVTFAVSMLERVIEEKARGDSAAASEIRREIQSLIGDDLSKLKPGSPEAMRLKAVLIEKGVWSQYLEVGIGPDAEIFTKAQTLSSVGFGAFAGLHPVSTWNNPEPEVVIVVSSQGTIVGATLGNDVNLRDVEGRSALLLSKAKDNNASCAIGPFIRLFDSDFTLDDVRKAEVTLQVQGEDGFVLEGSSNMARISRDPVDLVKQLIGRHHQYPDGAVLFLGTMFAPIKDREAPGKGFTHKEGDIVTVSTPRLGSLTNRMTTSDKAPPWHFGVSHLMRNLASRGLLKASGAA
jgi:fumarylacetoacetate (FAA) hydrolase family protein